MASLTKQECQEYDESLRHYRDTIAVMSGQFLEGEAKGRAEGRAEGIMDVVRKMKSKGRAVSEIMELTDLTAEEIASQ